MGFPGGTVVKNPPANERDTRDLGSIPGSGRSLEGGNGNPLQYSLLGNPMNKGAWRATVHVAKSQTRLRDQACTHAWWLQADQLVVHISLFHNSPVRVLTACAQGGSSHCLAFEMTQLSLNRAFLKRSIRNLEIWVWNHWLFYILDNLIILCTVYLLHKDRDTCLFYSQSCPKHLDQHQAHRKCTTCTGLNWTISTNSQLLLLYG